MTVYNNRDYEQPFILKDKNGNVINLTGCKLIFGFGTDTKTLGVHDSSATSNKCVFITDAANGEFSLKLPYSVLKPLEAGSYLHDLVLIDTSSKREGVWQGQMIVKRGLA